jgi:hypothetical protein
MEKYINVLSQKHAALDKEAEGRIKEFLTNAVDNKWNILVDVILRNGDIARLDEIHLSEGKVIYIQSEIGCEVNCGDMEFGEVLKVLSCLLDDEEFLRLNTILEKDNLYNINDRLLVSHPYHHPDLGKIVKFEIINNSLLLTNEEGLIISGETADFIKYLDDATYSMTIHADFLRIITSIVGDDDAEEIWDNYKEQIIDDIKECSHWHYNDSDVRIAISHLLRDKLLNE